MLVANRANWQVVQSESLQQVRPAFSQHVSLMSCMFILMWILPLLISPSTAEMPDNIPK